MERMPRLLTKVRPLSAALIASLFVGGAALLSGCGGGGSSKSVISTGFPQGAGPFSLRTSAASGGGSLLLSASNVPTPVFFPAPNAVPNTDTRLTSPTSAAGGTLTAISGTAYQVQKPTQPLGGPFPSPVTVTITYAPQALVTAAGKTIDPSTLDIYYFDGAHWQPVQPSDGGFSYTPAGTITTTIRNFVYPNGSNGKEGAGPGYFAVLSAQPPVTPTPALRP